MATKRTPRTVRYGLFENGLDFIHSGIECLAKERPTDRDYKAGILNLAAGVELVLKERLRQEHWSLLFEDADQADNVKLESGDFKSVTFEALISRLRGVCKITFSDQEKTALNELRKRRNKLQHLHFAENQALIESIAGRAVAVIVVFINKHLKSAPLPSTEDEQFEEIKSTARKFEAFVREQLDRIAPNIAQVRKNKGFIIHCTSCQQEALAIDGNEPHCLFCEERLPVNIAVSEWAEIYLERSGYEYGKGDGPSLYEHCPNCGEDALVQVGHARLGYKFDWLCFACGNCWNKGDLNFCESCSEPYESDDDSGMCGECLQNRFASYD